LDITLESQKFKVRNPLNQELHLCIKNTLKITYKHLEVKKFPRASPPGPPERGGKGWGEEREIGERRVGGGRGQEGEKGEGREGKEREGEGRRGEGMWPQ
jgi:hypothetical protein